MLQAKQMTALLTLIFRFLDRKRKVMDSGETYGFILFFDDGRNHYSTGTQMFFKARLVVGVMEVQSQGYDRWRCFSGQQLLKEWSLLHCMAVQHSTPVQESQGEFTMMRGYEIVYVLMLQLLCNVPFLLRVLQNT